MNFCPRCAAALETRVINDRPRRLCPSCGYTYWNNPLLVAGAAVINAQGYILLVRRLVEPRQGYWNLPAGFVEWGESAEEGARREVREESGLEVELTGFLASVGAGHASLPWQSVTYLFFYARSVAGTLQPGDDADQAAFFPPDALPPNIAFPSNLTALARWQRERERGLPAAVGLPAAGEGTDAPGTGT